MHAAAAAGGMKSAAEMSPDAEVTYAAWMKVRCDGRVMVAGVWVVELLPGWLCQRKLLLLQLGVLEVGGMHDQGCWAVLRRLAGDRGSCWKVGGFGWWSRSR